MPLRFLTAGESHGPALTVIVEGLPAGLAVSSKAIDRDLWRRMQGYGRGGRMKIEADRVEILGGVRFGRTLGSPVSLLVRNRDSANWTEAMRVEGEPSSPDAARPLTRPRPGHADLAGALKYDTHDARNVLERASARETTARTAAGALARELIRAAGVEVTSHTVAVGRVEAAAGGEEIFDAAVELPDHSPLRCLDADAEASMIEMIDGARGSGDSVGGTFEVLARGVPAGLGSHVHWDRRLDALLAQAVMSIPAVKAVSVGDGVEGAACSGSTLHDPIAYDAGNRRFSRPSNRAGGIEGGISNGEIVRVRGYFKPLATLPRPLPSVDLVGKGPTDGGKERTDTIPIVAAGVVGEAMVCLALAGELLRKFGGDTLTEMKRNLEAYRRQLADF